VTTLLYRIYQVCVVLPCVAVLTVITSLEVAIGCTLLSGHFFGYWPGRVWAWCIIRLLLLPVKIEGREKLEKGQSYVFVANHQGAFDIFLIFGFLPRNFKWMMKYQLMKIPFVGFACKRSHQIAVDKRSPRRIKESYDKARDTLKGGISLCVFPEGSRTFTGHMGFFRRGAFKLADELQLPVVPLTINGSFNVMPRQRDGKFVIWHPLSLTIHDPIKPTEKGDDNIQRTMRLAYDAIQSSLVPEYQGYRENPDQ